jgi:hypothetical protein
LLIQGALAITTQKEIPSPAGTQYLVEAQLQLRLLDRQTYNVLAALDINAKGLDMQSAAGAVAKASRNLKIPANKFAAFMQNANK